MLKSLHIRNFVLVADTVLSFRPSFTAITGETGSGKSILLQALNMISGERADFSSIGPYDEKTVVEAEFAPVSDNLKRLLSEQELDVSEEVILRREITRSGRSRAFVNDTPVSLAVMKTIATSLVEIHSQHHTIQLKDPAFQQKLLDDLAGNQDVLEQYRTRYRVFRATQRKLSEVREVYQERIKQADYNDFQLQELQELHLKTEDYAGMEADLNRFEHSDDLKQAYAAISDSVDADEYGIRTRIDHLLAPLSRLSGSDPAIAELETRLRSVKIELEDIAGEAGEKLETLEMDPEKMSALTAKLDRYNHVLRKHQLSEQEELVHLQEELESGHSNLQELESNLHELEQEATKLETELHQASEKLRSERKKAAPKVCEAIVQRLVELKMPETKLEFAISPRDSFGENGADDIELRFTPNKGMPLTAVHKAASGGELSRLMLVIQRFISERKSLPVMIFDEIDTGVSGDVAQKIGQVLSEMGQHMQLIAITHLPQVAARAAHHKKVSKEVRSGHSVSDVNDLSVEQRIHEIARLMSGEQVNETALQHAKALMIP